MDAYGSENRRKRSVIGSTRSRSSRLVGASVKAGAGERGRERRAGRVSTRATSCALSGGTVESGRPGHRDRVGRFLRAPRRRMHVGRVEAFAVRYPEPNNDGKIRALTLVRVETGDGL